MGQWVGSGRSGDGPTLPKAKHIQRLPTALRSTELTQLEATQDPIAKDLTKHLLSVHDLISAELASGQSSNAVHQNQLDVVVNNASFQCLQLTHSN